jgi:hypothetical protein
VELNSIGTFLGGQLGGRMRRHWPAPLVNLDEPEPEIDAAGLFPPGLHAGDLLPLIGRFEGVANGNRMG